MGVAPVLPPLRERKDLRPSLLAGLLSLHQSLCRLHPRLSLRPLLLPQKTGHQGHPREQNRQHYQAISAVDDQETLIIIIIKGSIISHVICILMLKKPMPSCVINSLSPLTW